MQFLQHVSYLHRSCVLPRASHSLHTYSVNTQLCQCINLSVIYFQLGKFLWKLTAPHRINYTQFEVHNPKCCYTTFIPSIQQLGDQDLWIQSPTAINKVFPKVEISGKFCSKHLLGRFIPCVIC